MRVRLWTKLKNNQGIDFDFVTQLNLDHFYPGMTGTRLSYYWARTELRSPLCTMEGISGRIFYNKIIFGYIRRNTRYTHPSRMFWRPRGSRRERKSARERVPEVRGASWACSGSWAHWAQFFTVKNVYYSRHSVFRYNLQFYRHLGMQ